MPEKRLHQLPTVVVDANSILWVQTVGQEDGKATPGAVVRAGATTTATPGVVPKTGDDGKIPVGFLPGITPPASDVIMAGTLVSRPAAGIAGRLYFITDAGARRLTRDSGSAWEDLVSMVVNEDGVNEDFRVEGVGKPNLFVVNASTNRVGILTAAPTAALTIAEAGLSGAAKGLRIADLTTGHAVYAYVDTALGAGIMGCPTNSALILTTNSSTRLRISPTGVLETPVMHNNGGAITGVQAISSGTWTPTLTAVANVEATTAFSCQWMRVGHVVSASGKLDVNATAALTLTQVGISLPVASNFAAAQNLGGVAALNQVAAPMLAGIMIADAVNDRAQLEFYSDASAVNRSIYFSFMYLVQ